MAENLTRAVSSRHTQEGWCAVKIIATLGPASSSLSTVREMLRNGMTVARLNFSHATYEAHAALLATARKAANEEGALLAILQDLKGPEVRTTNREELDLQEGELICLTVGKSKGDCPHRSLGLRGIRTLAFLRRGMRVFLNDGAQVLRVVEEGGASVVAQVEVGGVIAPSRGVQFPDASTTLQGLTAQDARDIAWGAQAGVDAIALSFVKSAADVRRGRALARRYDANPLIIAKIETREALDALPAILREADGIMIARGDLALAVPPAEVPFLQKQLVREARRAGKYAIVATQMLESMTRNPSPTRAEISDVANAVLDGADALMLSQETAVGAHPVAAVATMRHIAATAQQHKPPLLPEAAEEVSTTNHSLAARISSAVSLEAARLAQRVRACSIVAFTETGTTARLVSRPQGNIPIVVVSQHATTLRQSLFGYGLVPLTKPVRYTKRSRFVDVAREAAHRVGVACAGEPLVIVSGSIFGKPGETNTLTVIPS